LTARSASTTIEFAFSVMPSIKRFSQLRRLTENLTLLSEREIRLSRLWLLLTIKFRTLLAPTLN
jgi:hypothetical protein